MTDTSKKTNKTNKTPPWQQVWPWRHRAVRINQPRRLPPFLSPHSLLSSSRIQINIHFTVRIFESRISNEEVTFLLAAAEPLQRECVWSPGDVSLVIVNLSPLFLRRLLCGEQPSVCWGCEKPYTIRSNKPQWDLHVHCRKYLQAVGKMRALATPPTPTPPPYAGA